MTFTKGNIPWNTGKTGIFNRDKNPKWNGGRATHAHGYQLIASPNHPYKDKRGYVREHRLVMEKHLGRYLLPTEDVHHLNDNKKDNRIENLELFSSRSEHLKKYHREGGKAGWFKKGQVSHNKYLVERSCLFCNKMFQPNESGRKFCSQVCYWQSKRKGVLQNV